LGQASIVDFAAVGRVSKFVELKDVRLVEVSAKCDPKATGPLEAEFAHQSAIAGRGEDSLEVTSDYSFIGKAAQVSVIEIKIKYLVVYEFKGRPVLEDGDVSQFAMANGTLHSWPFVRELLFGLTSRMGFPAFKLGVMHFVPQKPTEKPAEKVSSAENPAPVKS